MKTTIDLPDESIDLHELVHRALEGDEIILAEAGTPLTPDQTRPRRRRAG